MYLISGNITSNVTGNLLVITGNGNIGNITSNFRTLVINDRVRVQFQVPDISVCNQPATLGQLSLPSLRGW